LSIEIKGQRGGYIASGGGQERRRRRSRRWGEGRKRRER
jgi:hypothetical protein